MSSRPRRVLPRVLPLALPAGGWFAGGGPPEAVSGGASHAAGAAQFPPLGDPAGQRTGTLSSQKGSRTADGPPFNGPGRLRAPTVRRHTGRDVGMADPTEPPGGLRRLLGPSSGPLGAPERQSSAWRMDATETGLREGTVSHTVSTPPPLGSDGNAQIAPTDVYPAADPIGNSNVCPLGCFSVPQERPLVPWGP